MRFGDPAPAACRIALVGPRRTLGAGLRLASTAGPLRGLQRPHRYPRRAVAADFGDVAPSPVARLGRRSIRDGGLRKVSAGRAAAAILAACPHPGWTACS